MSLLTKHRCAKIIQNFYKRFIKNINPIDPIDHDIIPANKRLKVIITNTNKITGVRYFNIDNLDTWFLFKGEAINPLTNLKFTNNQLSDIRKAYQKYNKSIPVFLQEFPIIININYNIINYNINYYNNINNYINNYDINIINYIN